MTHLVYPGALHTRFHHALGAMHLADRAVDTLRQKGHEITDEESFGLAAAILLHDIGHGPFSHALEHSIVGNIQHEEISKGFMKLLNKEFDGMLDTAIAIFTNEYHKPFLHQLVSSQLDMDRLDYLKRDSFYTGVHEGEVGSDRIIKMLNVHDGKLAIDEKAIYSIENFIVARRFMYWQVYLHRTVVAGEHMLINILERAKYLAKNGKDLFCSPDLKKFLYGEFTAEDVVNSKEALMAFSRLDDYDILSAIKVWTQNEDKTLSTLCSMLTDRKLFKVELGKNSFDESKLAEYRKSICDTYGVTEEESNYFLVSGTLVNNAYDSTADNIRLMLKSGGAIDLVEASDNLNISALSKPVEKHFICHAKF